MLLGGRTAEELIFADPTTGAQNDIDRATTIARQMVTEFGMSDALGPMRFGQPAGRGVPRPRLHVARPTTPTRSRPASTPRCAALIDGAHAVARDDPRRQPRRRSTGSPTSSIEHETLEAERVAGDLRRRRMWDADRTTARRAARPDGAPLAPSRIAAAATQSDRPAAREATRDRPEPAAVGPDDGRRRRSTSRGSSARCARSSRRSARTPTATGCVRTPARVAGMYAEIFAGLHEDPSQHLTVTFEADHDEMVMVRDIPLYSLCEHHLVPFPARPTSPTSPATTAGSPACRRSPAWSTASPSGRRCRSGSPPRSPTRWSSVLEPKGVLVVIEAEHLCMSMRGVSKPGSLTVTSAVRGLFKDNAGHPGRGDELHRRSPDNRL